MKKLFFLQMLMLVAVLLSAQSKMQWAFTTPTEQWKAQALNETKAEGGSDVEVNLNKPFQTIEGFGTCFNELGWTSLNLLSKADWESIMSEGFAPDAGAKLFSPVLQANSFNTISF